MISSDFRTEARRKLSGKWGKVALITLLFTIVTSVLSWVQSAFHIVALNTIISIAVTIIEVPLAFGFAFAMYKLFKGEEVNTADFFSLGFTNFKKAWFIVLHTLLKVIIPLIIFVVAVVMIIAGGLNMPTTTMYFTGDNFNMTVSEVTGSSPLLIIGSLLMIISSIWLCVKGLLYVIAAYIAFDNMEMPEKEVVEKSESLMKGKRCKYFVLLLTFIGWLILGAFTLGIAYLWIIPYIQFAVFAFYRYLVDGKKEEPAEPIQEQ